MVQRTLFFCQEQKEKEKYVMLKLILKTTKNNSLKRVKHIKMLHGKQGL